MPKYMLLLYDDPTPFRAMNETEMQKAIEKYVAWGDRLRTSGVLVGSDKLTDSGKVIRSAGGSVRVTDGPYSETKEVLGGHFTIQAASYDDAIAQTRDCPHFEYGGTIEVRQIDELE